jgi:methyltransferase
MMGAVLFLLFIVAQRLAELAIAKRNTARLVAAGAQEHGAGHYPLIVALHTSWIAALVVFGWNQPLHPGWLAAFAILQALRLWILLTLGPRWTTRIIVTSEPVVLSGPFRYLKHPNYSVVIAEIAVAPLVLGLPWIALVFSILNAALLFGIRIPAEERALGLRRDPGDPAL